jgi:hypothetical protein
MTTPAFFPSLDGLMSLSRREGVDIRPTLLRVLTDLYVQADTHSNDEERQFVELASRLIEQVDDATRAAVRARLALYPTTPAAIQIKLGLRRAQSDEPVPLAPTVTNPPPPDVFRAAPSLSMQPKDAAEIHETFLRANANERALILQNLAESPLRASARIPLARAARAIEILEMAAFAADVENFTLELGEALILPGRIAAQVVDDPGGEPLACAARALEMPGPVFQRVLLFLKPEFGCSVQQVYRLSRLYDRLDERSALVMLAAWRGLSMAGTRTKHQPTLFDDERQRARPAATPTRPAAQPESVVRTGTRDSGR